LSIFFLISRILMTTDTDETLSFFFLKQNVSISATYVIDNEILKCSSQQQDPRRKITILHTQQLCCILVPNDNIPPKIKFEKFCEID